MIDPKWLTVNGVEPKIASGLIIDAMGFDDVKENIVAFSVDWKTVLKYRLRNSPAGDGYPEYKDGVSIHELKCAREDIEQKADEWVEGELPADGTKCEAFWEDAIDWEPVTFKRGFDSKLWFSTSGNEIVIPAHDVTFRPIKSQRDKVIEAAKKLSVKYIYDAVNHGGLGAASEGEKLYDVLYDAGALSMPEGDNND